jgi:hypothetical protein
MHSFDALDRSHLKKKERTNMSLQYESFKPFLRIAFLSCAFIAVLLLGATRLSAQEGEITPLLLRLARLYPILISDRPLPLAQCPGSYPTRIEGIVAQVCAQLGFCKAPPSRPLGAALKPRAAQNSQHLVLQETPTIACPKLRFRPPENQEFSGE